MKEPGEGKPEKKERLKDRKQSGYSFCAKEDEETEQTITL